MQTESKDVSLDYFTDNKASGGVGGNPFRFIKDENGAVLRKIEGWVQDWRVRGIRVTMTDRSSFLAGKMEGDYKKFELEDDEYIARLNLQPTGSHQRTYWRLGAFWIRTSKDRDWGMFSTDLRDNQYWVDVGSGICCGIFGTHGGDVDRLGLAMLRKTTSAEIVNVTYPNLDLNQVARDPSYVIDRSLDNRLGSVNQTLTMEVMDRAEKWNRWTTSTKFEFGQSVTVKAGIPHIADFEVNTHWSVGGESSHSLTEKEITNVKFAWPITVPPRTCTLAEGQIFSDEIQTEFEGLMRVMLENGKCYEYKTEGTYEGASYLRSNLIIKEKK